MGHFGEGLAGGLLFLLNDFQLKFPTKCLDYYPGAILILRRTGQGAGCRLSLLMWLEGVETSKSPKKGGEGRRGWEITVHSWVMLLPTPFVPSRQHSSRNEQ